MLIYYFSTDFSFSALELVADDAYKELLTAQGELQKSEHVCLSLLRMYSQTEYTESSILPQIVDAKPMIEEDLKSNIIVSGTISAKLESIVEEKGWSIKCQYCDDKIGTVFSMLSCLLFLFYDCL